ncbi:MAG: DUF721 domain-containing protein [Bacteroidales bacterium]
MADSSEESPLKDILNELMEEYQLSARLRQMRIQKIWTRIVGQYAASQTKEITFKNGRLAVTLKSAALRNELNFAKSKIIRNINRMLGEEAVQDIRFF